MKFDLKIYELKNKQTVLLRSPHTEDADRLAAFWKQAAGETEFLLMYPEEVDLVTANTQAMIERYLSVPRAVMICIFAGGRIIGTVMVTPVDRRTKQRHRCSFVLAVLREYYHLGLGSELLELAMICANSMGYEQMELGVCADNDIAIALYRKTGFMEYGKLPNAFHRKDGSRVAEILMVKKENIV